MKETILVTGATGLQGGSVARFLLKSGRYNVRCLTRDPSKPEAKELEKLGAEIVQGDFENKSSIDNAMRGVYGVYANVDYWEHPGEPEVEIREGKTLADSAKQSNVKHFIFSGLESVSELTGGKLKVPQFDDKAEVSKYCQSIGLPFTEIRLAFYMENFLKNFKPRQADKKNWVIDIPMAEKPLDLFCCQDVGGIVLKMFDNPNEWIGKGIGVAGDSLTGLQIAELFTLYTGKEHIYKPLSIEDFKKQRFKGAKELGDMFAFYQQFAGKLRDVKRTREIYPETLDFRSWLELNAGAFKG